MAILTITDIARLAIGAGIDPKDHNALYTSVAISCAEDTSHDTNAVNHNNSDGSTDKGLWQINSIHDDMLKGQDRFDPKVNAALMFSISRGGTKWTDWVTYNRHLHDPYMPIVMTELGSKLDQIPKGTNPLDYPGLKPSTLDQVVGAVNPLTPFIPIFSFISNVNNWKRAGKAFAGFVILMIGIVGIATQSKALREAAMTAVPEARLTSIALKAVQK